MLLTYVGPAFHSTWNVPRGVWCTLAGLPGSMWIGPNVILPLAWSQVMCLARSTHARAGRAVLVFAAGQHQRHRGPAGRRGHAWRAARLVPETGERGHRVRPGDR